MGELVDLAVERARRRGATLGPLAHLEQLERELAAETELAEELEALGPVPRIGPAPWTLDAPAGWDAYAVPCTHCGYAFQGLEIRVGQARYHARRGRCREAALALLTDVEQALAEEARRSKLWATAVPEAHVVIALDAHGVPMRDADDRPVMIRAQSSFPARARGAEGRRSS